MPGQPTRRCSPRAATAASPCRFHRPAAARERRRPPPTRLPSPTTPSAHAPPRRHGLRRRRLSWPDDGQRGDSALLHVRSVGHERAVATLVADETRAVRILLNGHFGPAGRKSLESVLDTSARAERVDDPGRSDSSDPMKVATLRRTGSASPDAIGSSRRRAALVGMAVFVFRAPLTARRGGRSSRDRDDSETAMRAAVRP